MILTSILLGYICVLGNTNFNVDALMTNDMYPIKWKVWRSQHNDYISCNLYVSIIHYIFCELQKFMIHEWHIIDWQLWQGIIGCDLHASRHVALLQYFPIFIFVLKSNSFFVWMSFTFWNFFVENLTILDFGARAAAHFSSILLMAPSRRPLFLFFIQEKSTKDMKL